MKFQKLFSMVLLFAMVFQLANCSSVRQITPAQVEPAKEYKIVKVVTFQNEEFEFETVLRKRPAIQNNAVNGVLKDLTAKTIQFQEIKEIHYRELSEIKTTFLVLGIAAAVASFVFILTFDPFPGGFGGFGPGLGQNKKK